MSSSSWLQKQRKGDLAELADTLGLKNTDGLKKTELEILIDEHLKNNVHLASDTRVAPFYKRRSGSDLTSPVKREASAVGADAEKAIKSVKRRVTKVADEITNAISGSTDDSEPEPATTRARSSVVARTPARSSALAFASSVPLPPSPAVVADAIDRRTAVLRSKAVKLYEKTGTTETVEATREALSSVVSVEALIIAFEAFFLRKEVLGDRHAFTIPAIKLLGMKPCPLAIPDMFLLLTSSFWSPFLLWLATSFIIPLTAAYFFNLTSKKPLGRGPASFAYSFDPLTFNIVKALITYVVYAQDVTFGGLVDLESVARINSALYGGYQGVLVGTAVGAIVTFYEAIIRK